MSEYAYLFGLYLGDGMLSRGPRAVWRLRITLDDRYPAIIDQARSSIEIVRGRPAGTTPRTGCTEVWSYWKHWRCAFPQHGAGPKHERAIQLTEWQRDAIIAVPHQFLAGLIHSDGCRTINRVKGHEYPRYFFSNRSAEVRGFFVWACALVGVEARPANPRNLAVSRREFVAILDSLVGPKH